MALNFIIIFQSKALQNVPNLVFLVWKQTIWQPCSRTDKCVGRSHLSDADYSRSVFASANNNLAIPKNKERAHPINLHFPGGRSNKDLQV
jgi:hypothetical protein